MVELPEVTEITRWEYRPGDRLIIHTDVTKMNMQQAHDVVARTRIALQLPPTAPIVVAGEGWSFEVLTELD